MNNLCCGIDLGTTNSCIAYLDGGRAVAVPLEEGQAIVPSVVSFDETAGRFLVGRRARNRRAAYPQGTVSSIKRVMGKAERFRLGNRDYSPEEISAEIIRYLAEGAAAVLNRTVSSVVITVPAYFNDAQRRATILAGELAGLEVVRIINEPTAASLVYDFSSLAGKEDNPYILVYDLGGGTFDVSILEIKGEIKEGPASCGDTALGGDDFDERLMGRFLRHLKEKHRTDFLEIPLPLKVRLKEIAEQTKMTLSDQPYVFIREIGLNGPSGQSFNLDLELSRNQYQDLIRDLVDRTVDKVREALSEARLAVDDIGRIILVGGSTRTPLVQSALADIFERPMQHSIDPDLCVGLGAAVQHGLITGVPLGHILLDVTAHSLGVKTIDEVDPETGEADHFSVIIRRNATVPIRRAEVYYTLVPNQDGAQVEVYQGESPSCRDNTRIGKFFFPLKPAPVKSPIVTEFAYDREGIIHITVDQKGFQNRKEVTLDVRRKKILEEGEPGSEETQAVLNYIIQKARAMEQAPTLPEDLRRELTDLADRYETALRTGADDLLVDELEEALLERLEEAETQAEPLE